MVSRITKSLSPGDVKDIFYKVILEKPRRISRMEDY